VEAQHINRSLSALGDVIAALASNSAHVSAAAAREHGPSARSKGRLGRG
jgi:hypothetical protein